MPTKWARQRAGRLEVLDLVSEDKQSQIKVNIFVRIYLCLKERTYVLWPPLSCTTLEHSTRTMALAHRTDLSRYSLTWQCGLDRLAQPAPLVTMRTACWTLWRSLSPSSPFPFTPLPIHCSLHIVPSFGTAKRVVGCVIKKYISR